MMCKWEAAKERVTLGFSTIACCALLLMFAFALLLMAPASSAFADESSDVGFAGGLIFGEEGPNPDEGLFALSLSSELKDKKNLYETTHDVYWSDDWFNAPSSQYNSKLSVAAMGFSYAAYRNDASNGYKYITASLENLGFSRIDASSYANRVKNTDSDYATGVDKVAYAFATKRIADGNGEEVDLVAIVVRGTPTNIEWKSNANVADSAAGAYDSVVHHEGFKLAEEELLGAFARYVAENDIDTSTAKVLVTGHSRGAAVANILAAELNGGNCEALSFTKDRVYAYTFATPATVRLTDGQGDAYSNIFNFVNPEDFVPKVPLSQWGFSVYGETFYLPSKTTAPQDWRTLISTVDELFRFFSGGMGMPAFPGAIYETSAFMQAVLDLTGDLEGAYTWEHNAKGMTFHEYFRMFAGYLAEDGTSMAKLLSESLDAYWDVFSYFVTHGTNEKALFGAHSAETYFAWMIALDAAGVEMLSEGECADAKLGVIYGAVDVFVRDAAGALVAQAVDGVVSVEPSGDAAPVTLVVDGDMPATYVWLPNDQSYTVSCEPSSAGAESAGAEGAANASAADTAAGVAAGVDAAEVAEVMAAVVDLAPETADLAQEVLEAAMAEAAMAEVAEADTESAAVGEADSIEMANSTNSTFDMTWSTLSPSGACLEKKAYADLSFETGSYEVAVMAGDDLSDGVQVTGPDDVNVKESCLSEDDAVGSLSVPVSELGKGEAVGAYGATWGDLVTVKAYSAKGVAFSGWFDNGVLVSEDEFYTFRVEKNRSLVAKFGDGPDPAPTPNPDPSPNPDPAPTPTPGPDPDPEPGLPYSDLWKNFPDVKIEVECAGGPDKLWYVADGWLDYVVSAGLMSGYSSNGKFGPYDNITRGQVAVILYRAECAEDPTLLEQYGSTTDPTKYASECAFKDMKTNEYYTAAINWAKGAGILTGDAGTNYTTVRPNDSVARQELCLMLARYANDGVVPSVELDPAKAEGILGMDKIADWARDGVYWAVNNDVIGGVSNGDGTFSMDPTGRTWRSAAAKMFTVVMRDVLS